LYYAGVCALFVFLAVALFPSTLRADYIESFTSDIVVTKDTAFSVTENIEYRFTEEIHEILRCIPTRHPDKASSLLKERYIDVRLTSVRMDAHDVAYTIEKKAGEICVSIGAPHSTTPGVHVYTITYTVHGGVTFETYGGADLYWNITGHEWSVPMLSVKARVSSPDSILMRERSCYRGLFGKSSSCQISILDDGSVQFEGTLFNSYEGMTIAQSLDRSKIIEDVRERYRAFLLWGVIFILTMIVLGYCLYRYQTKHKRWGTTISQNESHSEGKSTDIREIGL
jgi:hypothetical protein